MTITPRQPFSVRTGLREAADDGPYEGVPNHLLLPLQAWVLADLTLPGIGYEDEDEDTARLICLRLRLTTRRSSAAQALANVGGSQLLDVVDALLAHRVNTRRTNPMQLRALQVLLDESGSAYRIREDLDGLEERVTPPAREAVLQAIADARTATDAGSAAEHLGAAWREAYGRNPDPVRAYSEAIKAAEAAAHAIVSPANGRATLGSMARDINAAPRKFAVAISVPAGGDPAGVVVTMMESLWRGQTSRHGARTVTVPETLEAARASVHLAATLVQWFTSGAVARQA